MSRRSRYVDPNHPDHVPDEVFYHGPSRSMLKREAEAQKDSVDDLLKLSKMQLKKFTFFDEDFIAALQLMQKMSFGPAYRRQRNYLAKRIRQEDWHDAIAQTLGLVTGDSKQAIAIHHRCEHWRDRLIEHGDTALSDLLALFPHADRQAFRQAIRLAQQEKEQEKTPKNSRILFKMLRELHEPQRHLTSAQDEQDDEEVDA
jgi:ribosome-associated protein